jgi:hypothetical protein
MDLQRSPPAIIILILTWSPRRVDFPFGKPHEGSSPNFAVRGRKVGEI